MRTVKSSSGVQLVDDTTTAGRSGRMEIDDADDGGDGPVRRSFLSIFDGRGGERVGSRRPNNCTREEPNTKR